MSKSTKAKTPRESQPKKPQDVALVCGKTEDGRGLHILRQRGSSLEAGVVQPLEEGKPIHGELVTLRQRGQTPLCDVEVHYAPKAAPTESPAQGETRGHPAQVASDSYRKNWDTIWKSRPSRQPLLN